MSWCSGTRFCARSFILAPRAGGLLMLGEPLGDEEGPAPTPAGRACVGERALMCLTERCPGRRAEPRHPARLFTLPFPPGHSTALPCPWSRAVIEIFFFSSLPPPQQLPFSFFLLFSSFSKCCWLSTWAEEEVKAEETNAGCHIAGVGWDREGSLASCPVASRRRDCPAHGSPRHAGAMG